MSDQDTARIVTRTERNAATSFRDNAGGDPVEQDAVTGRPNDLVTDKVSNSTFGDRAKAAKATTKAVPTDRAENKAVTGAQAKSPRRK